MVWAFTTGLHNSDTLYTYALVHAANISIFSFFNGRWRGNPSSWTSLTWLLPTCSTPLRRGEADPDPQPAPSPVAPMEDLGTLEEQHREQKLFPQLLAVPLRMRTKVSLRPHPRHWGQPHEVGQCLSRAGLRPEGTSHRKAGEGGDTGRGDLLLQVVDQTPGLTWPRESNFICVTWHSPFILSKSPANAPSRRLTLFFSTEKVAEQPAP